MKKQFGKLSKRTQEQIEAEYHHQTPEEFDPLMSRALEVIKEARPAPRVAKKAARKKTPALKRQLTK